MSCLDKVGECVIVGNFNVNNAYFLYVTVTPTYLSYDNVTSDSKLCLRHFKATRNFKVVSEDKVQNQS